MQKCTPISVNWRRIFVEHVVSFGMAQALDAFVHGKFQNFWVALKLGTTLLQAQI